MLTVTSDCCVLSGLNFETAGGSVVGYYFSSRASNRPKKDMGALS